MPDAEPTWLLDGEEIPLQGWHASFGYGGCLRAGGEVEAAVGRRAEQGSELVALVNEDQKWGGRVSRTPLVHRGKAPLEATGYRIKAERKVDRYMAQSRDLSLFAPIDSPPWSHVHPGRHKYAADAKSAIMVFRIDRGQEISIGDAQSLIFAAPGSPGGIQRIAFDWQAGNASAVSELIICRAEYPGVGDLAFLQHIGLNALSGSVDTLPQSWFWNGRDSVAITLTALAAFTTNPTYMVLLKNLRVNGIAPGDVFTTSDIVRDMGARLGFDVSGVRPSSVNALPFDLTSGNWLDGGLFHMSVLNDWAPPLILPRRARHLGPHLEYGPWGRKVFPLSLERDAAPDLTSVEIVNGVVVHFTTINQATDQVTVRPSDIGMEDPLAGKDADNFLHIALPEPQPDRNLATAMAKAQQARLVKPRNEGTLEVYSVPDHTRWDLLPGYHILAQDYGPLESVKLPIETLDLREGQPATVGIHSPGEELGLALVVGLERARAMQLAGFIRHEDLWQEALKDWRKERGEIAKELRRFYSGGRKGDLRDFKERRKQLLKDLHDKEATKGQKKTARRGLEELRKDRREREKELLEQQEEQLAEEPYPEDFFEPFP